MKLTKKLVTLSALSTLALTGCFGTDDDSTTSTPESTVAVDAAGVLSGALIGNEEIAAITILNKDLKNTAFYADYKKEALSEDRTTLVTKAKSIDLTSIGAKLVATSTTVCNGPYTFVVNGYSAAQVATNSEPKTETTETTEATTPATIPAGIATDTITYDYKGGVECVDGKAVSKLQFSDTLTLGSWESASPSWVDADNMTAHLNTPAGAIAADIDFMFVNEATPANLFFMSPKIAAGQQHASSKWTAQNQTKFVKVSKDLATILDQKELIALWANSINADQKTPALANGDVVLLETNKAKIVAIKVITLTSAAGKSTALVIGTLGDKVATTTPAQ